MKTIIIGADSAGFELKELLKEHLTEQGFRVLDVGCDSTASCHYPIFASAVATAVQADRDALGILVCGTGIGMSMVANKYHGIRAAVCGDTFSARMTRMHNDANVLCLGGRVVGLGLALDMVDLFIETEFEGGRHTARVEMIAEIEKHN
jgi:ribose 5-phosphate isomerase B